MKWTKANRRKYMREYMKKYVRRVKKLKPHPLEVKEKKVTPRPPPPPAPTKPQPKTPLNKEPALTCPNCGMLRPLIVGPCRFCGPGSEKRLPPSPPQSQRIPSGRPGNPRNSNEDENDQTVSREAGF